MLWFRFAATFALVLSTVQAQQGTGAFSGTVTDGQNALVIGALVEVKHVETSVVFRAQTNDRGLYYAPGMAVGRYEIRVEMKGFKRAVRSGLTLQVNQNAQVDFKLEIGQLSESISVVGETPLVDTTGATLGQVVENRRIQELPLNGRNALALSLLTAGVTSNAGPTNSGFGDRGIQLSSISINGSPNAMNAQMLDGNNNVLSYVGEVGVPPAVDAVEEFKVQSGTMSSEFGFTAGGAINLVTKSGTNQYHGTLYEFLRNDKFDARNFFATARLPLRFNQYGGSVGGPILKNKLFGFFNYEQYQLRKSLPRISTTPIDEWRTGNFARFLNANGQVVPIYDPNTVRNNPAGSGQVRDIFPGNIVPQARIDKVTPRILAFWPTANKTPLNAFTQSDNFQDSNITRVNWNQYHSKVDYRFNDRNSMFFRYTSAEHETSGNSIFTDQSVGQDRNDNQLNRNGMVSDTHTFSPTMVNNLRIGFMRQHFVFRAANGGQKWPSRLGLPPIVPDDQMPQLAFGYGTIGGQAYGTRGSLNWDIQNMLTKIWGSHAVKMGLNYRWLYGGNQQGSALSGDYAFGGLTSNPQSPANTGIGLAQFLLGDVSSGAIDRILGNSWRGFAWSAFIQDDWKVTRRLTLNLGLRWDFQKKPYERHDGHINSDLVGREPVTGLPGITVYAGVNGQPRTFIGEDWNDFGPRFGFAFDLSGNGKTVLRGGYGIFYPSTFYRNFMGNTTLFATTRTNYSAQGPGQRAFRFQDGFPFAPIQPVGIAAGPGALLGQGISYTEPDPTTPITQQWNFSVQHQLGSWMFDATYAGNKGNHFAASGYNLNQVKPETRQQLQLALNDALPNPWAGKIAGGLGAATISRERLLMPFPHYSSVGISNPRLGNYISHQFQFNLKRQFRSGFTFLMAYTGGKKMSDSTTVPVDFNSPQGLFNLEQATENGFQDAAYNRKINRSVDPTDVAQRAVVSALYELPFGRGKTLNPKNPVAQRIVGGWQVNVVGVMQSGIPLVVRGANNFQADRPNSTGESARLDNPSIQKWFRTDVFVNPPIYTFGNIGRVLPDVRAPGTNNFDLSIIKQTQIKEKWNLQFRAEAFNFLNKTNFGIPNTGFSAGQDGKNVSATFGRINSARDARIIQLGLKLVF